MFTSIQRTKDSVKITFESSQEADEFHDWYLENGVDLELCAPEDLDVVNGNQVVVTFNLEDQDNCPAAEPVNELLGAMFTKYYGNKEGAKQ